MPRICYNANGLRKLPLSQALRAVAGAGYEGVELSLHSNHIAPFCGDAASRRALRGEIAACGLTACCLATGADTLLGDERFEPSLISPSPQGRQRRVDLLRWSIDLAVELGVPVLNFASGVLRPGESRRAARDLLRAGIAACLEHAAGRVLLAIEPEPGFLVERNSEAVELVRELGAPGLRVNQDIGHENVATADYLRSIEETLPLTAHIHVEDIRGRVHRHEIPGEGDLDFPGLFAALRRGGYEGWISVELYDHADRHEEALGRSLRYLSALRHSEYARR